MTNMIRQRRGKVHMDHEKEQEEQRVFVPGTVFQVSSVNEGDHVLLCTDDDVSQDQMHRMKEELESRFPGVTFTFVCGITGVVVFPEYTPPISKE